MPVVYAKNLTLHVKGTKSGPEAFAEAVRSWVGTRWPTAIPWFGIGEAGSLRGDDGSIFRWEPFTEGPREIVDFTWRHADRDDPSISWITTATYFTVDGKSRLSLRVSNTWDGSSSVPFKSTTRPRLMLELLQYFDGEGVEGKLALQPKTISEGDVPSFVRYELFDRDRTYPILVLTPGADGLHLVDPGQLAVDFVSLARCIVLPTQGAAIVLTRELADKTLSVFNGAGRLYNPGFTKASDPFRHPLLPPRRIKDPDQRYTVASTLALETIRQFKEHAAIPLLRDERAVALDKRRAAVLATLRNSTSTDITTWKGLADDYAQDNSALRATVRDLNNTVDDLNDKVRFYEDKLSALEYALRAQKGVAMPVGGEQLAGIEVSTVFEATEYAQLLFDEDFMLLPTALTTASESSYVRPRRAFELLASLAGLSRKLREGPLGRSMKEYFADQGIDYRQGINKQASKKIRDQHIFENDGRKYFCDEHLCEGNAYDDRFSLRIYFTSDATQGVVVGHIGRHLDTDSTT